MSEGKTGVAREGPMRGRRIGRGQVFRRGKFFKKRSFLQGIEVIHSFGVARIGGGCYSQEVAMSCTASKRSDKRKVWLARN